MSATRTKRPRPVIWWWRVVIDIVRAGAADTELLVPLYMAFFREDHIPADEQSIRNNIPQMLGDARAAIWMALSDGIPVGLVSASLTFGIEFGWSA
jgi:aminoglycoside 6'-N-acetyltransferase I